MRIFRKAERNFSPQQIARFTVEPSVPQSGISLLYDVRFYDLRDRYVGGVSSCTNPLEAIANNLEAIQ